MNDDTAPETAPIIDSRTSFAAALRWGVHRAIGLEARELHFVDADFANWLLDEVELLTALTGWLRRPGRRLNLVAATYDDVPRLWPRFNAWRRDWAHAIEAWLVPEEQASGLPTLLLSDSRVSVHLIDAMHWRGRASEDARIAAQWRGQIDALLQRSERAFSVNTLGL